MTTEPDVTNRQLVGFQGGNVSMLRPVEFDTGPECRHGLADTHWLIPTARYEKLLALEAAAREWARSWHAVGNEPSRRMHAVLATVEALDEGR